MSELPREQWGSRLGFILAAVGSAVGLGNMWRFSYLAAENGGAAFLVLYIAMVALVGLPVMLAEFVIGRGSGRSPMQALAHFGGNGWRPLGGLFIASGFVILAYYSVIAGWTLRYAIEGAVAGFGGDAEATFGAVASGTPAILWHLVFMAITVFVVAGGVKKGIERTALILMPLLFAIVIGLAIYASTLDGAGAGYTYYFDTSFAEILSADVLKDAAGQAFFSLSLGMGAMLTFASYLSRENHLPNESVFIAGSDFAVAFIAGLVVFPMVFAFGLGDAVSGSTVGALFITLPTAFSEMGGAGRVVGFMFFASLVVGALTSAISLLEVVVSSAVDGLGWGRRSAAIVAGCAIAALGIPAAWNTDILGLMDQIAGNFFLVAGGLALSVFTGWIMTEAMEEAGVGAPGVRWFGLWRGLLRFVVPVILSFVLYHTAVDTWKAIAGFIR